MASKSTYPCASRAPKRLGAGARIRVALLVILGATACATSSSASQAEQPTSKRSTTIEQGLVSYYSDKLAGRPTASGEPYDPKALTAAHRTLPFGTIVEIERPTGEKVRVRINDRGPFKKGRIIDVSRRAAEELDLIDAGIAEVTIRVVR